MTRLGLIAGGGELPATLWRRCVAAGRPVFVIRLRGFADAPELAAAEGADCGLAELGKCFAALKAAGCEAVCFAGNVARPDFSALKPDWRGVRALPGAIAAARTGDDGLLRFILGEFEKEGFRIEGAEDVDHGLSLSAGPMSTLSPTDDHADDIARALLVARSMGTLDVGQAAVVAGGLVLAVEAAEGTDAMLARVATLPQALRGTPQARRGVLAKTPKPIQERRVDLPTFGVATIEAAAACGLAGVVGEAGGALIVDRDAVAAAADRLGLFVWGAPPQG